MAGEVDTSAVVDHAFRDSGHLKSSESPRKREDSPEESPSEDDEGEIEEGQTDSLQLGESTETSQSPLPNNDHPPLPDEQPPLPDEQPPLPDEEPPSQTQEPEDDGWAPVWDDSNQAFYFYNRFTQITQWENPRVPSAAQATNHDRIESNESKTTKAGLHTLADQEIHPAVAGGYNPAIHGSYDPNASYAQYAATTEDVPSTGVDDTGTGVDDYTAAGTFNRFSGRFQNQELQPSNFNDDSKARKQMNAFFDVDAAANCHDGRSLKAERAGRRLTKSEVKQFRERRRERKEEKRRAWLRD